MKDWNNNLLHTHLVLLLFNFDILSMLQEGIHSITQIFKLNS
jgi:hypothetical protein